MPSSLPAGCWSITARTCRLSHGILARARLGGGGINEGLTLMESLLVRQGKTCGHRRPARTEIFRTLSKRLRQVIRTLNLTPEDVESLEQAERSLQSFDAVLQRLEIAPENQLSDLRALLHSTATRFESLDPAPALPTAPPVAVSTRNFPALWSAKRMRRRLSQCQT